MKQACSRLHLATKQVTGAKAVRIFDGQEVPKLQMATKTAVKHAAQQPERQ